MSIKTFFIITFLLIGFGNYAHSQNDSIQEFTILEYGLPPSNEYLTIRKTIDGKWNIKRKSVGGCLVNQSLMDSVQTFNSVTYNELEKVYGENWKTQYDSEIKAALDSLHRHKESQMTGFISVENERIIENVIYNETNTRMNVSYKLNDSSNNIKDSIQFKNKSTFIENVNDSRNDIVYAGFHNLFKINFKDYNEDYKLVCNNCLIRKTNLKDTLKPHLFNIIPHRSSDQTSLKINSKNGKDSTFHFQVAYLPAPKIYLNGIPSNEQFELFEEDTIVNLAYKYTSEISLKMPYEIQSWEINSSQYSESLVTGNGNQIQKEIVKKIKQLESGSKLFVYYTLKKTDGTLINKVGDFEMK